MIFHIFSVRKKGYTEFKENIEFSTNFQNYLGLDEVKQWSRWYVITTFARK